MLIRLFCVHFKVDETSEAFGPMSYEPAKWETVLDPESTTFYLSWELENSRLKNRIKAARASALSLTILDLAVEAGLDSEADLEALERLFVGAEKIMLLEEFDMPTAKILRFTLPTRLAS